MKIKPLSIALLLIIAIAMAKAQKYTRFNKPIIDLNNKPQVTTPKLPEERRKLSIFPKNMVKYVVTSKPYAKVRTYSPYQVTTKRPVMQQLVPKDVKNVRTIAATRAPIMKYITPVTTTQFTPKRQFAPRNQYTIKPPVTQIPEESNFYESEEDSYMKAPSTRYNVAYNSENNLSSFDEKDYDNESEDKNSNIELNTYTSTDKINDFNEILDLDAVESNDSSKVNDTITLKQENMGEKEKNSTSIITNNNNQNLEDKVVKIKVEKEEGNENERKKSGIKESGHEETQNTDIKPYDVDSTEPKYEETESKELENNRKKRLTVLGRNVYNNIEMSNKPIITDSSAKDDSDTASERNDRDEFIFIKDYLKTPVDVKKSSNYIAAEIEDSVEIATEIAWLEEYKSRSERSINVIEEENLGTTVSGFKFTGREPRVDNDIVFKNINA